MEEGKRCKSVQLIISGEIFTSYSAHIKSELLSAKSNKRMVEKQNHLSTSQGKEKA
jgi:hypothetical protein